MTPGGNSPGPPQLTLSAAIIWRARPIGWCCVAWRCIGNGCNGFCARRGESEGGEWVTHHSELFTDADFYRRLDGPLDKSWRDTVRFPHTLPLASAVPSVADGCCLAQDSTWALAEVRSPTNPTVPLSPSRDCRRD